MLGLILTVGKLFTWGADEEALDSLQFVPGVCVRLLVLLTATMSAYHGVARFGNWVFSRRMVPVASANDCQKCVHVCACACVRLCACVCVYMCVTYLSCVYDIPLVPLRGTPNKLH